MKIGIDTFGCDHAKSGLGAYLLNFISNLPLDSSFEYELFGLEEDRYTYNQNNGINFVSVNIGDKISVQRLWHRRILPSFVKKNGYDAVIFPACEKVIASKIPAKAIVVVNSVLSPMLKEMGFSYRHQLKKGLNHAFKIISPTEYIKKDLTKIGIKSKKIKIVKDGIDHKNFFPSVIQEEIVQINPFAIKTPYFLCATRLSGPDKKHEELIKAFEIFKKKTNAPHRLVIAGDGNEYSDKIHELAFKSSFASDIFITGYFPPESLPKLYGAADVCIFPAINEGVGLPVLEAMACGVPVLCSDSAALKEMGEDAPLYFDSCKPESIADAMIKIVENPSLKEKMIEKGLKNASAYDWKKTVKQTLSVLEN